MMMKRAHKKYDITQCAFYKCRSKGNLVRILQIEEDDLNYLSSPKIYRSFNIPKNNTEELREVTAPEAKLKKIQRRTLNLLQPVYRPSWLISGEHGKSYINNGEIHKNANYMLTMDIASFYERCSREYIFRFFRDELLMAADLAGLMTELVVYKNKVPTGSPTGQIIAYYAYRNMFEEISAFAKAKELVFTLYVDDMTFSSSIPFNPHNLKYEIEFILRRYGHHAKAKKTKYYSKGKYKLVTGSIVSPLHQQLVPNSLRHKIITNANALKSKGFKELPRNEQAKLLNCLKGQLQAARSIEPDIFSDLVSIVKQELLALNE